MNRVTSVERTLACQCQIPRLRALGILRCVGCNGAILGAVDLRVKHAVAGDLADGFSPVIPAGARVRLLAYRKDGYHEVQWDGHVIRVHEGNLEPLR